MRKRKDELNYGVNLHRLDAKTNEPLAPPLLVARFRCLGDCHTYMAACRDRDASEHGEHHRYLLAYRTEANMQKARKGGLNYVVSFESFDAIGKRLTPRLVVARFRHSGDMHAYLMLCRERKPPQGEEHVYQYSWLDRQGQRYTTRFQIFGG